MVLPVYHYNNTKIYNVSGYDTAKLPEWLINKHRKKLKKDPGIIFILLLKSRFWKTD